jgi:hypothetical protein
MCTMISTVAERARARAERSVARTRAVAFLAAGWLLVYVSATALRPPQHASSLWYAIPETVFWGAAAVAGLAVLRGWSAGRVAAAVAIAAVVACPAVGHHVIGMWFPVQLAGTAMLLAANVCADAAKLADRLAYAATGATSSSTASK